MIVDDLRVEPSGDRTELSGRLRLEPAFRAPERIWFRYPEDLGDGEPDGTPFVPALLLAAMCLGEDLRIDGPVSARLLEALPSARRLYRSWWPALRDSEVIAEPRPLAGSASLRATLFTRGVDSMYAALTEPVDLLLYGAATDFVWGHVDSGPEATMAARAGVVELHRESAARQGRRLVVVDTNLRHFFEPIRQWGDTHGAILAGCGLAIGASVADLGIPSSTPLGPRLLPLGSHPLLDHHWSTEWTAVRHSAPETSRTDKLRRLVKDEHALAELLVCNGPEARENCCRCGMCLLTMVQLDSLGALARAPTFPAPLRLRDLARLPAQQRLDRSLTRLRIDDALDGEGRRSLALALQVGLARHHARSFVRRLGRMSGRRG